MPWYLGIPDFRRAVPPLCEQLPSGSRVVVVVVVVAAVLLLLSILFAEHCPQDGILSAVYYLYYPQYTVRRTAEYCPQYNIHTVRSILSILSAEYCPQDRILSAVYVLSAEYCPQGRTLSADLELYPIYILFASIVDKFSFKVYVLVLHYYSASTPIIRFL